MKLCKYLLNGRIDPVQVNYLKELENSAIENNIKFINLQSSIIFYYMLCFN